MSLTKDKIECLSVCISPKLAGYPGLGYLAWFLIEPIEIVGFAEGPTRAEALARLEKMAQALYQPKGD